MNRRFAARGAVESQRSTFFSCMQCLRQQESRLAVFLKGWLAGGEANAHRERYYVIIKKGGFLLPFLRIPIKPLLSFSVRASAIAAFPFPEGKKCVDDPSDTCDSSRGGAAYPGDLREITEPLLERLCLLRD